MKVAFTGFVVAALTTLLFLGPVAMADIWGGDACSSVNSTLCKEKGKAPDAASVSKPIIDLLLYVVAIISVVVIIISGIRYATSAGDASKIAAAKNTLLYAIVGLVVSVFAYAIVWFVYERIIT